MLRKCNFFFIIFALISIDLNKLVNAANYEVIDTNHYISLANSSDEYQNCFVENSLAYIFKPEILLKYNNRLGGKIGITFNDVWQSFEIDEKDDWNFVSSIFTENILKKKEV